MRLGHTHDLLNVSKVFYKPTYQSVFQLGATWPCNKHVNQQLSWIQWQTYTSLPKKIIKNLWNFKRSTNNSLARTSFSRRRAKKDHRRIIHYDWMIVFKQSWMRILRQTLYSVFYFILNMIASLYSKITYCGFVLWLFAGVNIGYFVIAVLRSKPLIKQHEERTGLPRIKWKSWEEKRNHLTYAITSPYEYERIVKPN